MNGIISSRDRQGAEDPRGHRLSWRKRSGGRRLRRVNFDRLEIRRLLTTPRPRSPSFPLRQFGGTPKASRQDPSGNGWVLLAPQTIAEVQPGGTRSPSTEVPAYNGLGTGRHRERAGPDHLQRQGRRHLVLRDEQQPVSDSSIPAPARSPSTLCSPSPRIPGSTRSSPDPTGTSTSRSRDLNEIGMFDITTDLISQFTMPLADTQPQGITVGGDGNLWFTEGGQNKIGSLNPITHVINNYAFEPAQHPTNDQAEGITAGPNNTIWFVTTAERRQSRNSTSPPRRSPNTRRQTPRTGPVPPQLRPLPPPSPASGRSLWAPTATSTTPSRHTDGSATSATRRAEHRAGSTTRSPRPGTRARRPTWTKALIANARPGWVEPLWCPPPVDVRSTDLYVQRPESTTRRRPPGRASTNDANDIISVNSEPVLHRLHRRRRHRSASSTRRLRSTPSIRSPVAAASATASAAEPVSQSDDGGLQRQHLVHRDEREHRGTATGRSASSTPGPATFAQSYLTAASSDPVGIVWDRRPRQQFWMTEPNSNQIVSYNPATSGSAVAPI